MTQILPLLKRIAQNAREKSGDGRVEKFFIFKFGRKSYAVPAVDVAEVAMPGSLIDVSQKSAILMGVINIRGIVIPVINMRDRIGLERSYELTDDSRLLLFMLKAGTYVGMLADEVEYRLRDGVVEPFPADYSGDGEKTFQTVIIENNRLPLFMVDVWLEKPEIEILQNVVESF